MARNRDSYDLDDAEVAAHIIFKNEYKYDRYGDSAEVTAAQLEWANEVERYFEEQNRNAAWDEEQVYLSDYMENIWQDLPQALRAQLHSR